MWHLSESLDELNKKFIKLYPRERIERFFEKVSCNNVLISSSFGAHSVVLLHILSEVVPNTKVLFIETGNHFPETIEYRDKLMRQLNLQIEIITADNDIHEFTRENETWNIDHEYCCYLKKVRPMDRIKMGYRYWISGLMNWQNTHRANLEIFEKRNGITKFHPLLDVLEEDFHSYIKAHKLPVHPLVNKGYESIGCIPCTAPGENRNGRWNGASKNECGLHL